MPLCQPYDLLDSLCCIGVGSASDAPQKPASVPPAAPADAPVIPPDACRICQGTGELMPDITCGGCGGTGRRAKK